MKTVSRFEANLLRILQFFLRRAAAEQAWAQIVAQSAQPDCLSRDAVELVQDHLAKGCCLVLARVGGWRRERFIRNEQVVEGRLWERTPPQDLGLGFSRHSLRFLVWITATNPRDEKAAKWTANEQELTPADRLFFYLAYSALRDTEIGQLLRHRPGFNGNVLCRLTFPEDFAVTQAPVASDYAAWMTGVPACILEALQPELAEAWIKSERQKGRILEGETLRHHGRRQELILELFLQAVEKSGRYDLARFLMQAAAKLLTPDAAAQFWVHADCSPGTRVADRVDTYRAALALVNRVERFQQWEQRARSVGYFDEGYAASQLVKAEWERWAGDELATRAQRIIRELDPLSVQTEGRS